jgi:DNA-directed RNA polymerase sigma subunit (sigma70/sigma32)
MTRKVDGDINKKYLKAKASLTLPPRYFEVFEFRHGLVDGTTHSLKESGERFGVSSTRIGQMEARVFYEIEEFLIKRSSPPFSPS